ncbi:MAG: hypothetical protein WC253_06895 [Sulfurovaceae bacterium]
MMNKKISQYLFFGLCGLILFGCRGIEGPWPGGPEWEVYEKLRNPKPALYYWQKTGASEEQKIRDWVECGGNPKSGGFPWSEVEIKKEMRPGDINNFFYKQQAYDRLKIKFGNCMRGKGYKNLRD